MEWGGRARGGEKRPFAARQASGRRQTSGRRPVGEAQSKGQFILNSNPSRVGAEPRLAGPPWGAVGRYAYRQDQLPTTSPRLAQLGAELRDRNICRS